MSLYQSEGWWFGSSLCVSLGKLLNPKLLSNSSIRVLILDTKRLGRKNIEKSLYEWANEACYIKCFECSTRKVPYKNQSIYSSASILNSCQEKKPKPYEQIFMFPFFDFDDISSHYYGLQSHLKKLINTLWVNFMA